MNIKEILNRMDSLMGSINISVPIIPPVLIQCGVLTRTGLSSIKTTQNVMKRLAALGFPITDNPDGTANMTISFAYNLVKGVYDGVTQDAVVEVPDTNWSAVITQKGIIL